MKWNIRCSCDEVRRTFFLKKKSELFSYRIAVLIVMKSSTELSPNEELYCLYNSTGYGNKNHTHVCRFLKKGRKGT